MVLGWKFPDQKIRCVDDGTGHANKIIEFPGGIPSQADQDKWTKEYEAYLSANEYKEKRKAEYPSIVDQLDDLYHNGIDGWKATIKVTKDKYPKG